MSKKGFTLIELLVVIAIIAMLPAIPLPHNGFTRVKHGMRQFAMPRHGLSANAGTNVLFFDLSARHVMVKEMWSLKWHKNFDTNRWNADRAAIWPGAWMDKLSEYF